MINFSIINKLTGDVVSSGSVPSDEAVAAQTIPAGCVLVRDILGISRIHKIMDGVRVDIPQSPDTPQIDRVDILIEALKAKGVMLTKADLISAAGRLK